MSRTSRALQPAMLTPLKTHERMTVEFSLGVMPQITKVLRAEITMETAAGIKREQHTW